MQYYEIETGGDNKTNPFFMNQITESKTALAKGLLGFQFHLVAVKPNTLVFEAPSDADVPSNTEKATDENSKVVRNYIGPCAGSITQGMIIFAMSIKVECQTQLIMYTMMGK